MPAFPSLPYADRARIVLALSIVLVLSAACSVKEDRRGCPCLLRLDFSEADGRSRQGKLLLSAVSGDGFCRTDTLDMAEVQDVYELQVPRGGVRVNLWSDDAGDFVGDDGLVIPFGDDCPPVLMYSAFAATEGEVCTETVRLRKNYCRLTVITDDEGGGYPFDLGVYGNVDGYDVEGRPRGGEFCHYLSAAGTDASGEDGGYVVLLPRQTDSSLMLDVMEDAEVIKTFALGNYISQSGYDWLAPDLEDIAVRIDCACTRIVISVGAWEHSYDVDIEF